MSMGPIPKFYQKQFKDISLSLSKNPLTGDIVSRTGSDAISDSVRNLLLTNTDELPFEDSEIGGNISSLLFSNIGLASLTILEVQAQNLLNKYELRIDSPIVVIKRTSAYTITVSVTYSIISTGETQTVEFDKDIS